MKKKLIFRVAMVALISTCIVSAALYADYKAKQPKANPILNTLQLGSTVAFQQRKPRPIPLAQPTPPDSLIAQAAPWLDSVKRANRQADIDKRTPGNLYMQKIIDRNLALGLSNQQIMFDKVDNLTRLLNEANAKLAARQDTIYLTPQVIQTDTIYKGLVPIPQNTNRERKGLEKVKEGVERYYRDSIRLGGRSQRVVGYQIS